MHGHRGACKRETGPAQVRVASQPQERFFRAGSTLLSMATFACGFRNCDTGRYGHTTTIGLTLLGCGLRVECGAIDRILGAAPPRDFRNAYMDVTRPL